MKSLKAGDKVYWNQKDKSVILAVIGKEPVHEGIKIVGSHIDSPRLDLKANPVHEQDGIVYFRTHYYGGIKKYQWTCIPLALIGVVFTKDGKKWISISDWKTATPFSMYPTCLSTWHRTR